MTASKTKAEVFGKNQLGHDRGTRAMSWTLTLLVAVICSFSFAATAEAASVRDDFDAISYSGTSIAGSRLAQPFQYQPGTIQVNNSVAQCATATAATAFQTDSIDGDVASYSGASLSIDAGDQNVANPQLDISASAVWALMFSVKTP